MYNVCIYGGNGKIGTGTARCLNALGYIIDSFDVTGDNKYTRNNFYDIMPENIGNYGKYDAVINCGPYKLASRVRKAAYDMQTKYIDFGGDTDIEEEIRNDISGCKYGVLTGVGIAPGYINLMASSAVKFVKGIGGIPKNLYIYTGGVSQGHYDNILGWIPTWSVDGLLKSYTGKSKIIRNGNIEEVGPFENYGPFLYLLCHKKDGKEPITLDMEAFCNSGGLSHTLYEMLDENLDNCIYYTLRWRGHADTFKGMLKTKEYFNITNKAFSKYIYNICNTKHADVLIYSVYLYYQSPNKPEGELSLDVCKSFITPTNDMSAMQLATCSSGASMIDFVIKENLTDFITYKDLNYYEVSDTIDMIYEKLGIPVGKGVTQYTAHRNMSGEE